MSGYQGSAEWLEERLGGYGSSDVPVLVAGDEAAWQDLHARKLRILPADSPSSETMRWGKLLEAAIAARYAEREGHPVVKVERILRHPELDFVRASLDRRRRRGRVVVELKKWGFPDERFGPDGSDQVPENWHDQVQQQLAVTGYDSADVAVLFAGGSAKDPFRVYHLGRDQGRIDAILELEAAAWAYIARGQMPPWPGPAPTRLRLAEGELEADEELDALLLRGYAARQAAKAAEKASEELDAQLKVLLAEHAVVRGLSIDATHKPNRDGEQTDWSLVAAAYRKAIEDELALLERGDIATSGLPAPLLEPGGLDAIERTFTRHKPGARPLRYVPHKEDSPNG